MDGGWMSGGLGVVDEEEEEEEGEINGWYLPG